MRLVFAGTPDAAVPSLRGLAASAHEITLVVTRPDAPRGRRRVMTPSPVAQTAADLGIDTFTTARLDDDATDRIGAARPDLGVVVAYGGLVREPLLSLPPHGWINLHFSLLPRWRGAAPVQHAIIAGDAVTGAAVFGLVPALDAGDVYAQLEHPIPTAATAGDLLDDLAVRGAVLLADVVDAIADGTASSRPQVGEPTLAPKLTLDDARVRWEEDAAAVLARIRGVTPEPGAFTTLDGGRVKILGARPGDSELRPAPGAVVAAGGEVLVGTGSTPVALDIVQPAGKAAMAAGDWWRGVRTAEPRVGT